MFFFFGGGGGCSFGLWWRVGELRSRLVEESWVYYCASGLDVRKSESWVIVSVNQKSCGLSFGVCGLCDVFECKKKYFKLCSFFF